MRRLILVEMSVDPFEPPKFKQKKILLKEKERKEQDSESAFGEN